MTTPLPASDDLDPAPPRVGRVVLLYALCAGLWISLSEAALRWLVADPALRALARVFEGWALIGVTSALLFGLLRRHMRLQKAALASEREALLSQDRALQLLRTLSDNSPDIIFAKDREGRYLLRNAAGLREIGRSTEQVIGRDDSAIFPAEQARQLRAHDERVKVQDHAETFEEELDTVDGRRIFLSTKGPLHDSAGGVIGMFGISHDITARRRAEDALRDAEALKHQVFEQLTDGVVLIDKTYRFLDANLHAVEMFGYPRDELLCLGVRDVLPAEELPRISEPLDAVVARRPDLAEWSLVRMDGGRFTAEVSARPLGEGRYVVVVRDITQRRAAEQALLTNQTELTELTQRLLTQEQQTTRRIAQSLHDRLGQTLAAARLTLEGCITTYARAMPAALKAEAHRIAVLLEQSQQEVRQVLTDLRPPLLEGAGAGRGTR